VVEHLTEIFCRGVLRPEKLAEMAGTPPTAARRDGVGRARTKSRDS
jgi:hypothetical protein